MNIENFLVSNTSIWEENNEDILISFEVPEYMNRRYSVRVGSNYIVEDFAIIGSGVSRIIPSSIISIGENDVLVKVYNGVIEESTIEFKIYKEDRDSNIVRDLRYNKKYKEGLSDNVIITNNGYELDNIGNSFISIPINTIGKDMVKRIIVNDSDDFSEEVELYVESELHSINPETDYSITSTKIDLSIIDDFRNLEFKRSRDV